MGRFKIGAVTAAAQCGASDAEIKKLGCWKNREYKGYVRSSSQGLGELPRKLAEANQKADQCRRSTIGMLRVVTVN